MTALFGRHRTFITWLWLITLILAACGRVPGTAESSLGTPHLQPSSLAPDLSVRPLSVVALAPPVHLAWPGYDTNISYPEVADGMVPLTVVNEAIERAVADAEHAALPGGPLPPDAGDPGAFTVSTDRSLVSASTAVVSALLPAYFHNPGRHDFTRYWIPVTVDVESGRLVTLSDLFIDPTNGLQVTANAVRGVIFANYPTCRSAIVSGAVSQDSLSPTVRNFKSFAVGTRGLVIGFDSHFCDRMTVLVPWPTVRPYLSPLGRRFAAGVREPAG